MNVNPVIHTPHTLTFGIPPTCETIGTALNEVAPSVQDLTKSALDTAKTREVSMAAPKDRPALPPDDNRHGTVAGRAQNCKCDDCRAAIATYQRRRRKRIGLYGRCYSVDARGTIRRIEALMALGWSAEQIARECGWPARNNVLQLRSRTWLEVKTARKVAEVYERMHMSVPKGSRVQRNQATARSKGWAVPLAWNDIDTDPAPPALTRGVAA